MEVMANNPKYSEYLTNDGKKDHLDVKKSTERIMTKGVSIVVEVAKIEAAE